MFLNYRKRSILLITLLSIAFSQGCKKESLNIDYSLHNYFPTTQGLWKEFVVDSIYHGENDNDNDDSVYVFQYQVREEIDSAFIDGEGRRSEIVVRYFRSDSNASWSVCNVWTQVITPQGAYRTENNIPYHKLAIPINTHTEWDGNDANTLDEELYEYEYFHTPGVVNNLSFDSTLSVLQIDENNYVEKIYGKEIYATGIGMIFKQRDELGKKNGIIVKGLEYQMRLINYGFSQ